MAHPSVQHGHSVTSGNRAGTGAEVYRAPAASPDALHLFHLLSKQLCEVSSADKKTGSDTWFACSPGLSGAARPDPSPHRVLLSQGRCCPPLRGQFWWSLLGGVAGISWVEARMPPNTLPCTGQPPNKECSGPDASGSSWEGLASIGLTPLESDPSNEVPGPLPRSPGSGAVVGHGLSCPL